MNKIFIGEFNEDDVKYNKTNFTTARDKAIAVHGNGTLETELREYKGHSYYFRRTRVYLNKN